MLQYFKYGLLGALYYAIQGSSEISVSSEIGDILKVVHSLLLMCCLICDSQIDYALTLSGGEYSCTESYGSATVDMVNATLVYER